MSLTPEVITASIGALGGIAAAWMSRRTHKEVRSPNGRPTGETVELIYKALLCHNTDANAHEAMRDRSEDE